jgi:hypothetical protein
MIFYLFKNKIWATNSTSRLKKFMLRSTFRSAVSIHMPVHQQVVGPAHSSTWHLSLMVRQNTGSKAFKDILKDYFNGKKYTTCPTTFQHAP